MLTEADVLNALSTLTQAAKLQTAIASLQMNHAPKHLEATHVRPNAAGYGTAFFMKKNTAVRTVTKPGPWGKDVTVQERYISQEFGDYSEIDRTDEKAIIKHLLDADSVAYALNSGNPKRFLLFADVPEPYVGFDFEQNKCLPIEAGYLALSIEKGLNAWKIITAFPCYRAYYQRYQTKVLHKK